VAFLEEGLVYFLPQTYPFAPQASFASDAGFFIAILVGLKNRQGFFYIIDKGFERLFH
jgi:hypothetical protein